jgi:NitT/TauT family transport system permease protein
MTRPLIASERFLMIAPPVASGLIMIALWELLCRALAVPSFLIPTPSAIAATFFADAPTLLRALLSTMRVTFIAFFAAVVLGTCAAFLFVQSRIIERSLFPYAVVLQVTPVVAIAPLIIILVKNTELSLIICATIIAIFPIISNTTIGLRSIDPGLANLFVINKATRLQTLNSM